MQEKLNEKSSKTLDYHMYIKSHSHDLRVFNFPVFHLPIWAFPIFLPSRLSKNPNRFLPRVLPPDPKYTFLPALFYKNKLSLSWQSTSSFCHPKWGRIKTTSGATTGPWRERTLPVSLYGTFCVIRQDNSLSTSLVSKNNSLHVSRFKKRMICLWLILTMTKFSVPLTFMILHFICSYFFLFEIFSFSLAKLWCSLSINLTINQNFFIFLVK